MNWYGPSASDLLRALRTLVTHRAGKGKEYIAVVKQLEMEIEALEKAELEAENQMLLRKYYLAMTIWPQRDKRTPSKRCTWGKWWQEKFGETLEDFAARAREQNLRERIREYELARYGHSELPPEAVEEMAA